MSAIKAAAAHLGTLREGRKTMIVVTEALSAMFQGRGMRGGSVMDARPGTGPGPPRLSGPAMRREMDDQNIAIDMVRTANDSNTAVHVLDPRGLDVAFGSALMLETLAYGSGGELHRSNDLGASVQRIVSQASATYLLGYTKDMPQDGRFHEIKVRVKRGGYEVRARAGYWAPKAEDVARAKAVAAAAVLPEPIATAFASLNPPSSSRLVDIWTGTWPLADGRSLLTVAWTRVPAVPGASAPASVSVRVTSGGDAPVERLVEPGGTTFEIGSGSAQLAVRVLDKAGEILDRETRTIQPAAEAPLALTPVVYVARTPAEARALVSPGRPGARRPRVRPHRSTGDSPPHLRHVGGGRGSHRAPDRSPRRHPDPAGDRRPLQRLAPARSAARLHRPRRLRHRLRSAEWRAPRRSDRAVAGTAVGSRVRGSQVRVLAVSGWILPPEGGSHASVF